MSDSTRPPDPTQKARDWPQRIAEMIMSLVSEVPESSVASSGSPRDEARKIAKASAAKAASLAGALALPPGPLRWATILPEIHAVWRIQRQMVADIAAAYDQTADLSREQMLFCLFRHTAAQAVRDLAVRAGERFIVGRASLATVHQVARKVGLRISRDSLGRGLAGMIPVVSALGVGGYAWYDTAGVARTAIDLFENQRALRLPDEPPPASIEDQDG